MARSTSPKSETIPTSTRIATPSTLATRSWSTARCVAEPEGRTPPVSVSHRRWLERTLRQLQVVEACVRAIDDAKPILAAFDLQVRPHTLPLTTIVSPKYSGSQYGWMSGLSPTWVKWIEPSLLNARSDSMRGISNLPDGRNGATESLFSRIM